MPKENIIIEELLNEIYPQSESAAYRQMSEEEIRRLAEEIHEGNRTLIIESALKRRKLKEGLIRTYNAEATRRFVCSRCALPQEQFVLTTRNVNGEDIIIPIVIFRRNETGKIPSVGETMERCGYFQSIEPRYNNSNNSYYALYEPKYTNDITRQVKLNHRYLYHLTPSFNLERIRRKGLCPKSKNGTFLYPDRTHLFFKNDNERQQREMLRNIRADKEENLNPNALKNISDHSYCILKIDAMKLPENVRLMSDAMFKSSGGVYTYEKIPPSAIVSYKRHFPSMRDLANHLTGKIRRMVKEELSKRES